MEAATAADKVKHELRLVHRYEMDHERSLRWALRQLMALEKSGADLRDEPESEPPTAPEAVAATPGGAVTSEKSVVNDDSEKICDKLASVGAAAPAAVRPGVSAGTPGGRRDRSGADPGPVAAPDRR